MPTTHLIGLLLGVEEDWPAAFEALLRRIDPAVRYRGETHRFAAERVTIEPFDLPITKGLQQRIHEFRNIDEQIELRSILDHLASSPPLDLAYSEETEARLPEIVGGISVALARTFKIIDPKLKNPQTEHWERSQRLFDLLL